ncbi:hypothetical protein UCRPC4_g00636 [Phaeomoniella chlamydospora]|uniref:Mitochondrial K+-H+ exchange-related-domain-containing protein n=1 Tax=Phaeomoniella chlamydospora TaxID=158046 RepID=A0A0G2HIU0_PHACM|nr:hypothetical protein UCRPC4_g00636 [Phaeomoniella chlamydospora]
MRLYLLPISTRRALIYCQRLNKQTAAQTGYADKISTKATETWAKWEASTGGWQKKTTEYGNKALQRIPFEEWGLKSIPPLNARRKAEDMKGPGTIEVVYPGNVIKEQDVNVLVRRLGTERQSLHLKKAWWSVAACPLTIPVGLIPVLPNLPFFYLAYRAWSHYRAFYGSKHLVYLVENNLLKPTSLPSLESFYSPESSSQFDLSPNKPENFVEEHLLLDESSHTALAQTLKVPELSAELERAVKQVRSAIKSQKQLSDQAQESKQAEKKTSTAEDDQTPKRP